MMYLSTLLFSLSALQNAHGFATTSRPAFVRFGASALGLLTRSDGYYQLEELEDQETATTEVVLLKDHSVIVGETDGPVCLRASGTWKQSPEGSFEMIIRRTFEAGHERVASTDMGEYTYDVERTFTGEVGEVGSQMSVSGSMHILDEKLGDEKVGYFTMIATTTARLTEDQKAASK